LFLCHLIFLDQLIATAIATDLESTYFLLVACVVADGAAATTIFELAVILLVTVKLFNVPTLVKLELTTVDLSVVPVSVLASAVTVIF
jgi:hypothetical protein